MMGILSGWSLPCTHRQAVLSMGLGGVDSSSHFCSHSREMKSYGEPGRGEKKPTTQRETSPYVSAKIPADGILEYSDIQRYFQKLTGCCW